MKKRVGSIKTSGSFSFLQFYFNSLSQSREQLIQRWLRLIQNCINCIFRVIFSKKLSRFRNSYYFCTLFIIKLLSKHFLNYEEKT